MPATSKTQAHYMQMALAVKHGHHLQGISTETQARLRQTAASMSDKQLQDFSHVAKKPTKKGA